MRREEGITLSSSDSWVKNSSDDSDDTKKQSMSISSSAEDVKYFPNQMLSDDLTPENSSRFEWRTLGQSPSHQKVLDLFRLDVDNEVIEDARCGPSLTNRALAEPVISESWDKKCAPVSDSESKQDARLRSCCSPTRTLNAFPPTLVMPMLPIPPRVPSPTPSPPPSPPPLKRTTIASSFGRVMKHVERERTAVSLLQQRDHNADDCLGSSYDIFRMDLEDSMAECETQPKTPMQVLTAFPQFSLESTLFTTPSLSSLAPRRLVTVPPMLPSSLPTSSSLSSATPSLQGASSNALVTSPARRGCQAGDCDARGRIDRKYKEIMGIMAGLQDLMTAKGKFEERDRAANIQPPVEAAVALCQATETISVIQPRSLRGRGRHISRWLAHGRVLLLCAWAAWFTLVLQAAGLLNLLGLDNTAIQALPVINLNEILSMLEVLGLLEVLWLLNGMPIVSGAFGRPEFYVDAATNTERLFP